MTEGNLFRNNSSNIPGYQQHASTTMLGLQMTASNNNNSTMFGSFQQQQHRQLFGVSEDGGSHSLPSSFKPVDFTNKTFKSSCHTSNSPLQRRDGFGYVQTAPYIGRGGNGFAAGSAGSLTFETMQITTHLREAFSKKIKGSSEQYRIVLQVIQGVQRQLDEKTQVVWFTALSQCVSQSWEEFTDLIDIVLQFNWDIAGAEVSDAYKRFLVHLVSATSSAFGPVIRSLVGHLYPRAYKDCATFQEAVHKIETVDQKRFDNIHETIIEIMQVIPSGYGILIEAIQEHLPSKYEDIFVQRFYLQNMLVISKNFGILQDQILHLAIKAMLAIDVEIKVDDLEDNRIERQQAADEVEQMADKLDIMLELMYKYINEFGEIHQRNLETVQATPTNSSGVGDDGDNIIMDECSSLFGSMVESFRRLVLNTHKSKYTQFLVFYMCSLDQRYAYEFMEYLLGRITSRSIHSSTRQSCAGYLASFIARAKFLNADNVRHVLSTLTMFLNNYINDFESTVTNIDAGVHCIFYSICQIVFYVFCFKHHILLATEEDRQFVYSLRLDRVIESKFNPFKVVLKPVVREFARILRRYGLYDYRQLIKNNRKVAIATQTSYGGDNRLETFFPFDPYKLANTYHYIAPLYQTWNNNDDDDDDDEVTDSNSSGSDDDDDRFNNDGIIGTSFDEDSYLSEYDSGQDDDDALDDDDDDDESDDDETDAETAEDSADDPDIENMSFESMSFSPSVNTINNIAKSVSPTLRSMPKPDIRILTTYKNQRQQQQHQF